MSTKQTYNKRFWLTPDSSNTGSVAIFDGPATWSGEGEDEPAHARFIQIADCHTKICLHQSKHETDEAWNSKVKKLYSAIGEYLEFLEADKP